MNSKVLTGSYRNISLWQILVTAFLFFLSSCGNSDKAVSNDSPISSFEGISSILSLSSQTGSSEAGSSAQISSSSVISGPVDPAIIAAKLGSGINLGNHFEGETWGSWGEELEEITFAKMAELGFKHVRIPVRWDSYTSGIEPFAIDSNRLDSIVKVVHHAKEAGLMVILNQHHHEPIYLDPEGETPRFLAIWKQVAEKLKDEGDYLLFEILNEPKEKLTDAAWHKLFPLAIQTIRESNPYRTLVIGGVDWNSITGMLKLKLPSLEKNLIATFHYYDPFQFTHQGADWTGLEANTWLGKTWSGKEGEQDAILSALTKASNWGKTNGVPVYLGEFGAYEKADSTSRALWTEFVSASAKKLGIPSAYWEWSSGFGLYNNMTGNVTEYLRKALLEHSIDWENWPPRPDLTNEPFLLIDDFEDSQGDLPLTAAIGAKWSLAKYAKPDSTITSWYYYRSDSSNWSTPLADTLFIQDEIDSGSTDNRENMISTEGFTGNGIAMSLHLWGQNYPWAGFGTNLHPNCDSCYLDFSNMTALSFMAKGEGRIQVKLSTRTNIESIDLDDTWGAFTSTITLNEEWTQHILWADMFVPSPYSALEGAGAEFSNANAEVKGIEFMGPQLPSAEADMQIKVWIDDVRIYGVDTASYLGIE